MVAATLLLALTLTPARGKGDAENDRPDDRTALSKRGQDFLQALAKGDAKAVAGFWTDSGEYHRGEDLTIREIAAIVSEVVGYAGDVGYDSSKPDGTPRKLLDVSRLRDMGWSPRICLRDGIVETYRWFIENHAVVKA